MQRLGWNELDVLLVVGDAYVDHPSFGAPLLGRWLVAHGWRTGIIAQPRWDAPDDMLAMGRPRLFAGVSAGALDSMLAHYTAFRKKRSDDAYTPGGQAGARPNRAVIVYANLVRRAFPGLPILLGGVEASLRRVSHYDFWQDKLRRSVLLDAKADVLAYGMAEHTVLETARRLSAGESLWGLPGTVQAGKADDIPENADVARLPSHEEIERDPKKLIEASLLMERQVHSGTQWALQSAGGRDLALAPPAPALSTEELDALYGLPFARAAHPIYEESIPAVEMIRNSVTTHRGCGGGCSFCSLALHQGRRIRSRSKDSILREVQTLASQPRFTGAISDVGGPSANMWNAQCAKGWAECKRSSCLVPKVCKHLRASQMEQVLLLRGVARTPGVRHVRVASGLRMDLALQDPEALACLTAEFVGGQLKIAPEHLADSVLKLMRKPSFDVFERFLAAFDAASKAAGKQQYAVPYLMSAHPGCTDQDMHGLQDWLHKRGWKPQQVQCFIPLPGTVAAAMYYAGADEQGRPIHVARTDAERLRQHGVLVPTGERKGAGKTRKPESHKPSRPRGKQKRKSARS